MSPTVLLHPAFGAPALMAGLARALGGEVVRPALPGHPGGPAWDRQEDFFECALTHLDAVLPADPVNLFGHSLGGVLGLAFALRHPTRVRSLVLYEPVFFAAADLAERTAHLAEMGPAHSAYMRGDRLEATRLFSAIWSGGVPWEALPQPTKTQMAEAIDVVFLTSPHLTEDRLGLLPHLPKLTHPTLILSGGSAYPINRSIARGLEQTLPNATRAQVLHPSGHMAPVAAPTTVAPLVAAFWDQALA